jgi:nitrate reductase gamma subunit
MEGMIAFAKGPLFAVTFGVMALGLIRLIVLQVYTLVADKGARIRNAPWRKITREASTWVLPFRHLIRGTVVFSMASYLSHFGMIIVPLFLADHVVLWERFLGVGLPAIGFTLADALTLLTLACLLVLLGCRIFVPRHRAVSRPVDFGLLVLIIVPFGAGFLASHPSVNPFRWDVVMLVHLLSAEMLMVVVPFTKLSHVVLFAFDRISEVHWQLRPGAGDKVAEALFGNEAKV